MTDFQSDSGASPGLSLRYAFFLLRDCRLRVLAIDVEELLLFVRESGAESTLCFMSSREANNSSKLGGETLQRQLRAITVRMADNMNDDSEAEAGNNTQRYFRYLRMIICECQG